MTAWPLNWRDLIEEAVRRRKSENLSQAALAAIAGVSRATVLSFERGDTNLQLSKVFDLLTALGLLEGVGPVDSQDEFAQASRTRWQDLVADLAEDDPARLPYGHVSYDYWIEGAEALPLKALPDVLRAIPTYTGWPPFRVASKPGLKPYNRDNCLECWLGSGSDRLFRDAGHSDFWRIAPEGRAFLRRGYQEDGPDNLQPGAIFDLTLPIWRCAEVLLHAAALARALSAAPNGLVHLRATYSGLEGRELVSWAKPLSRNSAPPGLRARSSSATLEMTVLADGLEDDLEMLVGYLLRPLYARFDGFELPDSLFAEEIAQLRRARPHSP
ncbi:MAG TPA: helix-turn-helix transcriptional regulator [Allosphingosinicella sp.]|nr:helix-turn-helix transcriptional regulator [Allosphingosinicella sp.]